MSNLPDNLDYLLDYIRPTILIYDDEFKSTVTQSLSRLDFKISKALVFGDPSAENSVENVLLRTRNTSDFQPKDLSQIDSPDKLVACISFTSGTTGNPKAVQITHSMFFNKVNAMASQEDSRLHDFNVLVPSRIRWVSQIQMMFLPILFGGKKTFSGRDAVVENICDLIEKWKVTVILSTNTRVHWILDHYKDNPVYDFSALNTIISSGEAPCSSMNARFKSILPNLKITHLYGMTECAGGIASHNDLGGLNGGRLYKGHSLKIVDENGVSVGHDTPGIIHVKERVPFLGYYKKEDENKATYKDGWLVTGDYGFMTKDNLLHVYCRFKDIPRCNGKLIIPNVVEDHLNKHGLVDISQTRGVHGSSPDNQKIAIFVKLAEDVNADLAKAELIEHIKLIIDLDIVANFEIVECFKIDSTGKVKRDF